MCVAFSQVEPHVICNNVLRMMQQLVVTVNRAWETSHIYLTTIWSISGVVYFINTNNECNVYVDRTNASTIRFTKSDFN